MTGDERPEDLFADLARDLLAEQDVREGTGFGRSPGLRVGDHIFAMLVRNELVVKLPAQRCAELVGEGDAKPLTMGKRRMREWVSVGAASGSRWRALADEALAFVRG